MLKDYQATIRAQPLDLDPGVRCRRRWRCRSRCASTMPAATARLNDALYRVSGASARSTRHAARLDVRGGNGRRPARAQGLRLRAGELRRPVQRQRCSRAAQPLNPIIDWGPGLGDDIARTAAGLVPLADYIYQAQAIFHTGTATSNVRRRPRSAPASCAKASSAGRASTITTSSAPCCSRRRRSALEYQPVTIPDADDAAGRRPLRRRTPCASRRRRRACASTSGRSSSTCMRSIDPEFTRAIYFGMFAWLAAPLLDALQVGARLRRQLGLVDHRPDDPDQPRDVPAAAQERRVDAADAGDCSRR